jgi:hypothetical protein
MLGANSEADTIKAAYLDHVKTIFIGLCTSLEQGKSDQQGIKQFTTGYSIAKRARDLALGIAGAAAPQVTGTGIRKKRAKRS